MSRVPNTTRRALRPEIGTSRGCPRRPHAARRGGKSKRSVSSSKSLTHWAPRRLIWARIRRFFLSLGIRVEHAARSFPGVILLMQFLAERLGAGANAAIASQMLLEQGNGPLHRGVTPVDRGTGQAGGQQRSQFLRPERGVIAPTVIRQAAGIARGAV